MTEIDRTVIPEPENRKLEKYLVHPKHGITIISKEESVDRLHLENSGTFRWENLNRDHLETEKAECRCGFTGETINEAKEHLQNPKDKPSMSEIRQQLKDVAIHGFEFNGFEGHGTSIVWKSQQYAFKIYATPTEWLTSEEGTISIQVHGITDTPFDQMNGMNGEKIGFENGLTFKKYIEIVRDYIEDNLLRDRWYTVETDQYDTRWDNRENKCVSLVIKEIDGDKYDYGLFEMDGITKTLLDRGSHTECVQKSIVYRSENPLAKVKSYKQVIENSDHKYRG